MAHKKPAVDAQLCGPVQPLKMKPMPRYKDLHDSEWQERQLNMSVPELQQWIEDQGIPGGLNSRAAHSILIARRRYQRALLQRKLRARSKLS